MRILAAVIVALTAVTAAALSPPCPCLLGVSPTFARSSGGETVTLTGFNLRSPVRIFVDVDSKTIEAFVVSVTESRLQFITPRVDMKGKPIIVATIRAIFDSGTPRELRATSLTPLVYQDVTLTPLIVAITPSSGPLLGGARVTIFGQGFQAPVQVFFGQQEAQVLTVSFSQIVVFSPASARVGPVDVRVVNVGANTSTVARDAYQYAEPMRVTSISPSTGPAGGFTRVRIQGSGFDVPVAITIAGLPAQPISVTRTEIIVVTLPVFSRPCTNLTGAVVVTNIVSGESATGPAYTYSCTSRRRVGR